MRDVMIRGASGLQHTGSPYVECKYTPSNRVFEWPNGSYALTFSSEKPDQTRGHEFDFAWADELAAWRKPRETWANLKLGMSKVCVINSPSMSIPLP